MVPTPRTPRGRGRLGHRQGTAGVRVAEPELSPHSTCRPPRRRWPGVSVVLQTEKPTTRESRAVRQRGSDLGGCDRFPVARPAKSGNRRAQYNIIDEETEMGSQTTRTFYFRFLKRP